MATRKKAIYTEACSDLIWACLFDGTRRAEEKLEEFYKWHGTDESEYSEEVKTSLQNKLDDIVKNHQAISIWNQLDREAQIIEEEAE